MQQPKDLHPHVISGGLSHGVTQPSPVDFTVEAPLPSLKFKNTAQGKTGEDKLEGASLWQFILSLM